MQHPPNPHTYDPERPVTHQAPAPCTLQPEAAGPPRMPRALRFLRVLFSLWGTVSALAVGLYAFLLLSLYVFTPPNFDEWLAVRDFTVPELWVMPVLHGFRALFCLLGAVRLGRGGRTGRRWALVAVGVEAGAVALGGVLGVATIMEGPLSVVGLAVHALAWSLNVAVGLLFPALLCLLLLVLRSSREWFRATGA
ncbi:hypothetical protein [Nocardiopsis halotolerans]|uniref:hypothetical protein n=1 Tax=Nocardiopsis halotolerans TaxID=124252 RepID=UPI00034C904F|nr:hypothetical protein [Nocardiopsis halotolerans]